MLKLIMLVQVRLCWIWLC